jgi:phosphoribosylformylglycinamidine cyclo-ligase
LDYIALGKEDDELVEQLAKGLVAGAKEAGVAIVGGETAIVSDLLKGVGSRAFDLVSMGVGVVERESLIDGSAILAGDVVVGVGSSGLHSNGYTLARRIVKGRGLDEEVEELGETIGEALLRPTKVYVEPTLEAIRRRHLHGIAHITGGAFSKLTRLVGDRKLRFELEEFDESTMPPIFRFLQREGHLSDDEVYKTFNMGVGLCLVMPPSEVEAVLRDYRRRGFEGRRIGTVVRGEGVVVGQMRIA